MMIFCDFDNTFYPHYDDVVFRKNIEVAQEFRKAGNQFGLATGRSIPDLENTWPDWRECLDYIILNNGSVCMKAKGEVVFRRALAQNLVMDVRRDIMREFGDEAALVYACDTVEKLEPSGDVCKIQCWVTDREVGNGILGMISEKYNDTLQAFMARGEVILEADWLTEKGKYRSYVDIVSAGAGKAKMIENLCSMLGVENVTVVGDDVNDLEMIREFNGYAMRNSAPEVLKIVGSKHIIESVGELLKEMI